MKSAGRYPVLDMTESIAMFASNIFLLHLPAAMLNAMSTSAACSGLNFESAPWAIPDATQKIRTIHIHERMSSVPKPITTERNANMIMVARLSAFCSIGDLAEMVWDCAIVFTMQQLVIPARRLGCTPYLAIPLPWDATSAPLILPMIR
jgi:hypothetical protein